MTPKEIWMEAFDEVLESLGLQSINEVTGDARDDVDALVENLYQQKLSDLIDDQYGNLS